jgi:serine/threonine protein kinase
MSRSNADAPIWSDPSLPQRRTIDLLCRDFEEQWQSGQKPDINSFLQSVDQGLHHDLLPELVAAEWELKTLAGEPPVKADYAERFPQLSSLLTELEATDFLTHESSVQSDVRSLPQGGEEFCGYHILRELGRGAMGTVFLAEVPVIGHQVALKILESNLRESHIAVTRFEREAKLLSKLDHPGLVPLYSYGESQGLRYLVMKAINGVSLSSAISSTEPLEDIVRKIRTPEHSDRFHLLLSISRQLVEALQAVHAADVLHRDIKPSNILLTNSGQVFLTDFSLAKVESTGFDITRSDEFVGTLRYCAPESLDGVYSQQGDIYSLGLVLFELFSLTSPFQAKTRRELLNKKLSGSVPEMASHAESIPCSMLPILQRMTAYDSPNRYQSAAEVLEALELPRDPEVAHKAPRRRLMLNTGLILMMLVAGLFLKKYSEDIDTTSEKALQSSEEAEHAVNNTLVAVPKQPITSFAVGSDSNENEADGDAWLIPERQFALPRKAPVSLVSLSDDGTHVIFVMMGASLFMGPFDAERLPMINRPYQSEIVVVDQSVSGDIVILVNQDFGRPTVTNQFANKASDPAYFVEVFNQRREKWMRISGSLFQFAHGMPHLISGLNSDHKREILIPEPDSPAIFHPETSGYKSARWPGGVRMAIGCYGQNGIAVMKDGRVVVFSLGYRDLKGTHDPERILTTPVADCQTVQTSPDGRFAIITGKTQACVISIEEADLLATFTVSQFTNPRLSFSEDGQWLTFADLHQAQTFDLTIQKWHGEALRFETELLVAKPVSGALLTVEKSGRVRQIPLPKKTSQPVREFQSVPLSSATFSAQPRRLALATEDGQVMFFRVP